MFSKSMDVHQGDGDLPLGSASTSEHHAKAQEFKNSGNDKFNKNNYKGAIIDYRKGLLHEPDNSDLHANLSAAYLHLEKYIEAEEHAVCAIQIRPTFYKGYMRAAKAAHGKYLTRLALLYLQKGLNLVADPDGRKELRRLKTQYTSYLSLESNADREIEIVSDAYESDDDEDFDEPFSDEEETGEPESALLRPGGAPEDVPEDSTVDIPAPGNVTITIDSFEASNKTGKAQEGEKSKESTDIIKAGSSNIDEVNNTTIAKEKTNNVEIPVKDEETKLKNEQLKTSDKNENRKGKDGSEGKPEQVPEFLKDLVRDTEFKKHISDFKCRLKSGSEAFLAGSYRKAVDCYKAAREQVGIRYTHFEIDDRQYQVIKYAQCAALINTGKYDETIQALQILTEMKVHELSIPAIHFLMARAYFKLNRFKTALDPLEKVQSILENCPIYPTFTWPGTTETILETTPAGLKNALKELNQVCRMPHKPTAVCRFDNCLKTSAHMLPSEFIFTSDPDFIGYVRMTCEEKCHIEFHIPCWKSYKESTCDIGKINDKDFLGRSCLTTDCVNSDGNHSLIITIEITGPDGQVKSVNKVDPKGNVDSKNSKKKKCRLDDKEKNPKPKKIKEKRVRETKKPVVAAEEEEDQAEPARSSFDPEKDLQAQKEGISQLREVLFGLEGDRYWNPKLPFYGRLDESEKASLEQFVDDKQESVEVRDAKNFLFTYFMPILKEEGPLKQSEVEDLWKESAGDFCDITVVLPNLKSMCELLIESTRFCLVEDYICLADQLDEAYELVKGEVSETVTFLMTGSAAPSDDNMQSLRTEGGQSHLPDLLRHPHTSTNSQVLFLSQSNSEDEVSDSSEEESGEESDESYCIIVSDSSEKTSDSTPKELFDQLIAPPGPLEDKSLQFVLPKPLEDTNMQFVPPKSLEDTRFSLQEMLNEMSRVKSYFMKSSDDPTTCKDLSEQLDSSTNGNVSPCNDTLETAHSSAISMTDVTKASSKSLNDDQEPEILSNYNQTEPFIISDEENILFIISDEENILSDNPNETVLPQTLKTNNEVDESSNATSEILVKSGIKELPDPDIEAETSSYIPECDKASQIEVPTEEKHMQTSPMDTQDRLSQTKESALYKESNKKVKELSGQLAVLSMENSKLAKDLRDREALNEQIKKSRDEEVTILREENRKALEAQKSLTEKLKTQLSEKETSVRKKEQELKAKSDLYNTLLMENGQVKKNMTSLVKDLEDAKRALSLSAENLIKFEKGYETVEQDMKMRLQKTQQAQLDTIKVVWESQINLLRKRCVEKISEMQSWFSMFPPEEVEDLPSWGAIRLNTLHWSDISKKIQLIEANFQVKCNALESCINNGEEVGDLSTMILPVLPEEPTPLPLDRIHKEITEKLHRKIGELTQLVVNQQLEIVKSKDNHQAQKMLSSYPRMQSPMTTAFGGLALQYSFPTPHPQLVHTPVPTLPPNQETGKIGNASNMLSTNVQTLLQESSKGKSSNPEFPAPLPIMGVGTTTVAPMLPPPIGVAQNLLKTSSALTEKKDKKQADKSAVSRRESTVTSSSRESTPIRTSGPVSTPEKSKKKKKRKSESKDTIEVKCAAPASVKLESECDVTAEDDWSVVGSKSVAKYPVPSAAVIPESKLKNKKKLLETLQLRFFNTPVKDLDEVVKVVREQNDGSLSGLPFDEIESRVGRILSKRQWQKTTTLGLDKFSDMAWGPVKQQETVTWTSLQLEECTICLEPMGTERTKVNCNHEFHTKCLRQWLNEKRVCPLCNKFTTMPDEFPAL